MVGGELKVDRHPKTLSTPAIQYVSKTPETMMLHQRDYYINTTNDAR